MALKFYRCKKCGQFVLSLKKTGCDMFCCGEAMSELKPGEIEGAKEKHIPVATRVGNIVKVVVGEVAHPMLDVHYIEWIGLTTDKGFQIKYLKPGEEPKGEFALSEGETPLEVVAYCNLHGLWGAKL